MPLRSCLQHYELDQVRDDPDLGNFSPVRWLDYVVGETHTLTKPNYEL